MPKKPPGTIFDELVDAVLSINAGQVIHATRLTLTDPVAPGEKVIGIVDSIEAKLLWTLSVDLHRQAMLNRHAADHDARTEEERNQFAKAWARLGALSEISRLLSWVVIRDELPGIYGSGITVSMRKDWQVIMVPTDEVEREDLAEKIAALGVAIPITVSMMRKIMQQHLQEIEPNGGLKKEEPPKKPQ